MKLADLNGLDDEAAAREFLRCCGSTRWARRMAESRPFAGVAAMAAAGDVIWSALQPPDWLEAFAAHPKIGEGAGRAGAAGSGGWSDQEQAGVAGAAEETLRRLADANRDYAARFGYIFIVCAAGKSAGEMLALLETRLRHDAEGELRIAVGEQWKITRLRLNKLVEQEPDTSS